MKTDAPVVIVGGGPVGLALALGLARHGAESVVLEARGARSLQARAAGILPRSLEILAAWGVADEFLREGAFQSQIDWQSAASGASLMHLDMSPLAGDTRFAGILLLPQHRTEALLEAAAMATGLVDVRYGHRCRSATQGSRQVKVQVAREDGDDYLLRCRYVVGCDGLRSEVRRALGLQMDGKTYPQRFFIYDYELTDGAQPAAAGQISPQVAAGAEGYTVALPLGPRLRRVVGVLPAAAPAADGAPATAEALSPRARAVLGDAPGRCLWASDFAVHSRIASHFGCGRILLAGDAAHVNSPIGGQGMNAGLQDAHNLAWKLAYALRRSGDGEALVRSYEAERRPSIARGVARTTDWLTRLLTLSHAWSRRLAAAVLRFCLRRPALVGRLLPRLAMLDQVYDASPLLAGHHRLLGHRAPNAWLRDAAGSRRWLASRQGCQPLLLLFDDEAGSADAVARGAAVTVRGLRYVRVSRQAAAGVDVLHDAEGALWRAWEARPGMLALVRPDGYVGWVEGAAPSSVTAAAARLRQALGLRPLAAVRAEVQAARQRRAGAACEGATDSARRLYD